jgi:hypothetical protein
LNSFEGNNRVTALRNETTNMSEQERDSLKFPWDDQQDRSVIETVRVFGCDLRAGDHVRLWPKPGADIMDLALAGKVATIEAIERDLEDNVHLAVVVDDDPGRDLGLLRQPGHRFFFSPAEVEPMTLPDNRAQE